MNKLLPTWPQISREALTVIAGAVPAAAVVGYFPALKAWIKKQWE